MQGKDCPECGAEVLPEDETCPECDAPLKKSVKVRKKNEKSFEKPRSRCGECGTELGLDDDSCPECGVSMYGGHPGEGDY